LSLQMNKYLEKLATVIDKDEAGNIKVYPNSHKYAKRANKAKLINPPKSRLNNKYLKGALIGGTVAKAGLTAGVLYSLHKKHKNNVANREKETLNHVKQAGKSFHTSSGEPGASINANSGSNTKRDLLQTGVGLALGGAATLASMKLHPNVAGKFGKMMGRDLGTGALIGGTTLAADYATTRANNNINEKFNAS
jgi:hypothetical protein